MLSILFDPRIFFDNETVDLAERMTKLSLVAYKCPLAVAQDGGQVFLCSGRKIVEDCYFLISGK
ncbi:MAG: hypothetical protein WB661_02895 [Candidatus Bathyarchaeia archaeon]